MPSPSPIIRFVPIGDSYTEGTGIDPQDAWPTVFAKHLQAEGIDIELLENPARGGWTTRMAIEGELPLFRDLQPNFSTLFIGANDLFQGKSPEDFQADFIELIDAMLSVLPGPSNLIALNLPDYSLTPAGAPYGGDEMQRSLTAYNQIIEQEAISRGVTVVDIHAVSPDTNKDPTLVATDGLHPSALGHRKWEEVIYKTAFDLIKMIVEAEGS